MRLQDAQRAGDDFVSKTELQVGQTLGTGGLIYVGRKNTTFSSACIFKISDKKVLFIKCQCIPIVFVEDMYRISECVVFEVRSKPGYFFFDLWMSLLLFLLRS